MKSALDELKKEFAVFKKQEEKSRTDVSLIDLTERISSLIDSKESLATAELTKHTDLINLMREVVKKASVSEDMTASTFDLKTEKRLLISLMYSVLADLGRKQAEKTVVEYIEQAKTFFSNLGLSKLYNRIEAHAK